MNKVILFGRLGKDPEKRTTQAGKTVCKFTLATDRGYGDSKQTDWHNITAFDKLAENCSKYLKKGSQCLIEGRIQYDTFEKDGAKRTSTSIIAQNLTFVGGSVANGNNYTEEKKEPDDGKFNPFIDNVDDEPIPF